MNDERDIKTFFRLARLSVHQNHQYLVRVLHMPGNVLFEGDANVADISTIHNKIQFVRAQIKFKPRNILRKRKAVKYYDTAVLFNRDFKVKAPYRIIALNEVY